jgi:hypothetical protein
MPLLSPSRKRHHFFIDNADDPVKPTVEAVSDAEQKLRDVIPTVRTWGYKYASSADTFAEGIRAMKEVAEQG